MDESESELSDSLIEDASSDSLVCGFLRAEDDIVGIGARRFGGCHFRGGEEASEE
jgi:hypothetical protein